MLDFYLHLEEIHAVFNRQLPCRSHVKAPSLCRIPLTRATGAWHKRGRGTVVLQIHNHHLLHTMSQPNRVQISPKEGSLLLAISAFQSGQCASISAAAATYEVPKTTLARRLRGGTSREDYMPGNKKLSHLEEEVIVQNILKLDAQGLSPTTSLVKEMADAIYKARGIPPVGVNWPYTFIKRTPALKTRLRRTYECQRRLCEDPKVIESWFELVKNTINKYGILQQDIYNFDKTGFQMGQISASIVVTATDRQGRPKQVKPTNTQ
jgi:hypothetical protein